MAIVPSIFRRVGSLVVSACFVLTLLNFLAFLAGMAYLGGTALNGKIEAGRYYVSNHGRYTEVSLDAFEYSRAHGRSVEITIPAMLLLGIVGSAVRIRKSKVVFSHGSKPPAGGA